MGPLLDGATLLEDEDHVRVADRGETVRDHEGRPSLEEAVQVLLHRAFRSRPARFSPLMLLAALGVLSIQPWTSPRLPDHHVGRLIDTGPWEITGTVDGRPLEFESRTRFALRVERLGDGGGFQAATGLLRVTLFGPLPAFEQGDRILFKSRIRPIRSFQNPGGFDYRRYMGHQEVWAAAVAEAREVVILERAAKGGLLDVVDRVRGRVARRIDAAVLEPEASVLKALIMLAYVRKFEQKVRQAQANLYHRPLLMALVNSVNTEDADLKLFFRELVRIGKGEVDDETWAAARAELRSELRERPDYLFEDEIKVRVDDNLLASLSQDDMLLAVYNGNTPGEIEILVRPSNQHEVAFKLKTSDDPFALVRIGDISGWLKQELAGYEINQHFTDEGYFERLNHPDSDINLLLGSRSFYEGWDSNRPNVIMYVNIGIGTDAKKFILQSVGRGVRIEPFKNQRKRLRELHAGGILSEQEGQVFEAIKNYVLPLESLFIFGTNREALNLVIGELDQQDKQAGEFEIALEVNEAAVQGKLLLIPVYQSVETPLYKNRDLAKFALSAENMDLLRRYLEYINDDRVLLAIHDTYQPEQILALRESMGDAQATFRTDGRAFKNLNVLARQALQFFSVHGKEFGAFKPLEDEINHFRHIRVALEEADFASFELQLRRFLESPQRLNEIQASFLAGNLTFDQVIEQGAAVKQAGRYEHQGQAVQFKRIAQHYYLPMLVAEHDKLDYLRSVTRVESEVRFLTALEDYLAKEENKFQQFDWWLFSRVDERSDNITIPYYYPFENRIANFKPDFIFWLQKGERYYILFVDPKGTGRTEYEHKIDGYQALFEVGGRPKIFNYPGMKVSVHVSLFTDDVQNLAAGYRRYWFDSLDKVLATITEQKE